MIDENSDSTEAFIAHQLPDLVGAFITPFVILAFLFIFDWRLGLLSLIPLALGFVVQGASWELPLQNTSNKCRMQEKQ